MKKKAKHKRRRTFFFRKEFRYFRKILNSDPIESFRSINHRDDKRRSKTHQCGSDRRGSFREHS